MIFFFNKQANMDMKIMYSPLNPVKGKQNIKTMTDRSNIYNGTLYVHTKYKIFPLHFLCVKHSTLVMTFKCF